MKKSLSFLTALIFSFTALSAQNNDTKNYTDNDSSVNGGIVRIYDEESVIYRTEVPSLLKGIWYNSDRYIVFEGHSLVSENEKAIQTDNSLQNVINQIEPDFVMRTFYTWYDDFACGNINNPERNNTTTQEPVKITVSFETLTESETSGAWIMKVNYNNNRDIFYIPLAVIDNKIYLSFKINTEQKENNYGYWQDYSSAKQITICNPVIQNELTSYYITPDAVYHIRYWQTKMDFDPEAQAVFSDEGETYSVKKHIFSGGKTYTCVNGRSTTIRNIEKSEGLEKETLFNKENTICATGRHYLSLVQTEESMEQIMQKANSRHKPLPKPVFPPSDADFHWEIIKDLRKYSSFTAKQYNRNLSFGKE